MPFPLYLGLMGMARGSWLGQSQAATGVTAAHLVFISGISLSEHGNSKIFMEKTKTKPTYLHLVFNTEANLPPNMASTEIPFRFRQVDFFFVPKGV